MNIWKQKVKIPEVGEVFVEAETKFPWEVKGHIERILKLDYGVDTFDIIGAPEKIGTQKWFTLKHCCFSDSSVFFVIGVWPQHIQHLMHKRNLKVLIEDIERALAALKSEVYSDTAAYSISSDSDKTTTYLDINDEDGLCDWLWKPLDF